MGPAIRGHGRRLRSCSNAGLSVAVAKLCPWRFETNPKMKIVKQYNNFACVLACFESYLADHGHTVTQAELLARYPDHCNVGKEIEGAFSLSRDSLARVGRDFGFAGDLTLTFAPADKRDYFIVTTEGDKHCVRVRRYLGGTKFEVMDPNINRDSHKEEYAIFDFAAEGHRQPAFLEINPSA